MEYFLIHKDQPTEYLLIGTKSFNSFWPDQGLRALMNIVEKTPEALTVLYKHCRFSISILILLVNHSFRYLFMINYTI